jgi:hypothetical protein
MRWIWLGLATAFTIAALWGAGELHRQSCLSAHLSECSVLPWQGGHQSVSYNSSSNPWADSNPWR